LEVKRVKKVAVAVLALAFAMLSLPVSSVFAVCPMIEVSGTIKSSGTGSTVVKEVGINRFMFLTTKSNWTGGIFGNTVGSQTQILHNVTTLPPEHIVINVELSFVTALVAGKRGTMTVEMNLISFPSHPWDNHGTWRIKDAAGGLAGLHGEGEWITYTDHPVNMYEGTVHFSR
jgi:hypothetical protein